MTAVLGAVVFLLKWIGILLLVILGFLLLVTILLLLVPVRYRGKIKKEEEPEDILQADGLLSWLNPFLRVRIRYREKKLCYTVRLLGFSLINSEKPKKKKEKRKKKYESGTEEDKIRKSIEEVSSEAQETPSSPRTAVPMQHSSPSKTGGNTELTDSTEPSVTPEAPETARKKNSFLLKIKLFLQRVKEFPGKVKQKIVQLGNTLKKLWDKKERLAAFFENEQHRMALGKAGTTVKQVISHVLPGKIKGYVEFGTGDPESTGKALGVLGVLYAAYGKGLTIQPDFYEKRLVADIMLKGRVRFGTLLFRGLSLIRDRNVTLFRKDWKKLWKALRA